MRDDRKKSKSSRAGVLGDHVAWRARANDVVVCSRCSGRIDGGQLFVRRATTRRTLPVCLDCCQASPEDLIRPYRGRRRSLDPQQTERLKRLTPEQQHLARSLLALLRDRASRGIRAIRIEEAEHLLLTSPERTQRLLQALLELGVIDVFDSWESPWSQITEVRLAQ